MNTKGKRAFITGIYGQDGSYLAEYLIDSGYEVLGLINHSDTKSPNAQYLENRERLSICVGDLCNIESFSSIVDSFSPHEVYNLAAVSDLKTAEERPEYTREVNFHAFKKLVEHLTEKNGAVRIFQALSSRILTPDDRGVIHERSSLLEAKNAYDEAKRDSYEKVVMEYRRKGFFIVSGFLCNHESPRRGDRFVTGKIASCVARIDRGSDEKLEIGNIDSKRDWSFAGDLVRAMYATLSVTEAHDYVIGSSELHTVKEFIDIAFLTMSKKISWQGEGVTAKGFDESGILRVVVNPDFYQTDDNPVVSDTSFLKKMTCWEPRVSFQELISMMVQAEVSRLKLL